MDLTTVLSKVFLWQNDDSLMLVFVYLCALQVLLITAFQPWMDHL